MSRQRVSTRRKLIFFVHGSFVCQIEPKNVNDALGDSNWVVVMQDELNQFTRNDVWSLVPRTNEMNVIGTKWVFRNKMDENCNIVRNKARLVVKGYNQEEGIDFDEIYAPIAWLEAVRLLLAYACMFNFKISQMEVKSAFLNGFLNRSCITCYCCICVFVCLYWLFFNFNRLIISISTSYCMFLLYLLSAVFVFNICYPDSLLFYCFNETFIVSKVICALSLI